MKIDELRSQYRKIRNAFCHSLTLDCDQFDRIVQDRISGQPTPEKYVATAGALVLPCRRCCGTGQYVTHTENGEPKGPGGVCYRCVGKGEQTLKDATRNFNYDLYGAWARM